MDQPGPRNEEPCERTDGPVHEWFGLTYVNFLVWHRSRMQSMPLEWQRRFVELAEELAAAYPDDTPEYEVTTVRRECVSDLSDAEMRFLGIGFSDDEDEGDERQEYYLKDGTAVSPYERVGLPVRDPVPHYDRGRTYLPPDESAIAAVRQARTEQAPQPL